MKQLAVDQDEKRRCTIHCQLGWEVRCIYVETKENFGMEGKAWRNELSSLAFVATRIEISWSLQPDANMNNASESVGFDLNVRSENSRLWRAGTMRVS
jgi:hypothetical protein